MSNDPTIERLTVPTPYLVGPVHLYLVRSDNHQILIDTGPPTDEAWEALHTALDPTRLNALLLTHCHPDHYGLAARLAEKYALPVYLSRYDAQFFGREDAFLTAILAQSAAFGVPADEREQARESLSSARRSTAPPASCRLLEEAGNHLESFGIKAFHCPGHSQGDHVFQVGDQLIGGDVMIPGALPVPLLDVCADDFSRRFNNYSSWCGTIARLGKFSAATLWPAHGDKIDDIGAELLSQSTRLLERAAVLAAMLRGRTDLYALGHELYAECFKQPFVQYLKLSELVFMQDLLHEPERLRTALAEIGLADSSTSRFAALAKG